MKELTELAKHGGVYMGTDTITKPMQWLCVFTHNDAAVVGGKCINSIKTFGDTPEIAVNKCFAELTMRMYWSNQEPKVNLYFDNRTFGEVSI